MSFSTRSAGFIALGLRQDKIAVGVYGKVAYLIVARKQRGRSNKKGPGQRYAFERHAPSDLLLQTWAPASTVAPPPNDLNKFCIHYWIKPLIR
jgi:hypothetical protein